MFAIMAEPTQVPTKAQSVTATIFGPCFLNESSSFADEIPAQAKIGVQSGSKSRFVIASLKAPATGEIPGIDAKDAKKAM